MKNNIFKFATKELSQDAFLAWLINWANDTKDSKEKELAHEFLLNMLGSKHAKWKELIKNNCNVEIVVQFYNIDVLAMIDNPYEDKHLAIIIEDKVLSLEHDSQIQRYKDVLPSVMKNLKKYRIKGKDFEFNEENLEIISCYYKPYDECGEDAKKNAVDCLFTRDKILKLLRAYKNDIKDKYFQDYLEYIEAIEECAKPGGFVNPLVEKKQEDIKYFAFFKKLENKYNRSIQKFYKEEKYKHNYYGVSTDKKHDVDENIQIEGIKKERVNFGRSTSGNQPTWWCNIPINFQIESDVFSKYAFIKINFEEGATTVRLKVAKTRTAISKEEDYYNIRDKKYREKYKIGKDEIKYYKNEKYYWIYEKYDGRKFKNDVTYNTILELFNNSKNGCKLNINKAEHGNTKNQSEMNIFTINIDEENKMQEIEDTIEIIINTLKNKKIKINTIDDKCLDLKVN